MAGTDQAVPRARKRASLGEALADLVLREGLNALSLRPAAARLGTSDRMLLYYFGSKLQLVTDTLAIVSSRLTTKLAAVQASPRLSPARMVEVASGLISDPDVRPYMALWAEIAARAMRKEAPFGDVACWITEGWIGWIAARTGFPSGIDPDIGASAMLAVIEAISSQRLVTRGSIDPHADLSLFRTLLAD